MRQKFALQLFIAVMFLSCLTACKTEVPYQARNAEECIQEKECVWYAFEKLVISAKTKVSSINKPALHKWTKGDDIEIRVIGRDLEQHIHDVAKAVATIDEVYPDRIQIAEPASFNIIFIDESDRDFYNIYGPELYSEFGNDVYKVYKDISRNHGCFGFTKNYKKNENAAMGFYFIRTETPLTKECISNVLFMGLGFGSGEDDLEFSLLGNNLEYQEPTALDLFLIKILYHPAFYSAMPFEDMKEAFDKAYADSITQINLQQGSAP